MRIFVTRTLVLLSSACGQVAPVDAGSDANVPETSSDGAVDATIDVATDAGNDATSDGTSDDGASTCTDLLSTYPCNTLPKGALVNVGCTATPPTPQGGVIADGFYNLTQVDWDTTAVDAGCPSNLTRHGTIEVCGSTLLWLDYDETQASWRGDTNIQVNGTTINFQEFCSGNEQWTFSYSATSTQLVMFFVYPSGERLVMTFVHQ